MGGVAVAFGGNTMKKPRRSEEIVREEFIVDEQVLVAEFSINREGFRGYIDVSGQGLPGRYEVTLRRVGEK